MKRILILPLIAAFVACVLCWNSFDKNLADLPSQHSQNGTIIADLPSQHSQDGTITADLPSQHEHNKVLV